jgi:RHS repeat-associated protein
VRVYSASSFGRVARVSTDESLTYNAANEMNSAAGVNYTYDGDGQRVEKSSGTLYWYGPGGEVLDETDLSGNLTSEYVYFNGRRVARRNASGSVYYYAGDFLGSARAMVTSSGAKCYDADFYPFGGERSVTNTCPQNYKFTGKERDSETGNDYFGARYYASNFGRPDAFTETGRSVLSESDRFLSPDWSAIPAPVPYANLTNPQTLNLYAIVRNNPETFADFDGHCGPDNDPKTCKDNATTANGKLGAAGEGSPNPGDGLSYSSTQQAQQLSAEVPQPVKEAIMASLTASNAPTADDMNGGFHEESGIAGTDAKGNLVISPDKPGPYANPDTTTEAHTSGQPVDQGVRNSIAKVAVAWHIHPSGRTATHEWVQPPSAADREAAIPGAINIVVGARNKTVYFYGSSGSVIHISLKKFMGGP